MNKATMQNTKLGPDDLAREIHEAMKKEMRGLENQAPEDICLALAQLAGFYEWVSPDEEVGRVLVPKHFNIGREMAMGQSGKSVRLPGDGHRPGPMMPPRKADR